MHTQWPMTAGWLDVVALNRPRIVHIQQSTRIVSRARAPSTSTQTVKLVQYNTLNGIYSTPISSSALHTHTHSLLSAFVVYVYNAAGKTSALFRAGVLLLPVATAAAELRLLKWILWVLVNQNCSSCRLPCTGHLPFLASSSAAAAAAAAQPSNG